MNHFLDVTIFSKDQIQVVDFVILETIGHHHNYRLFIPDATAWTLLVLENPPLLLMENVNGVALQEKSFEYNCTKRLESSVKNDYGCVEKSSELKTYDLE